MSGRANESPESTRAQGLEEARAIIVRLLGSCTQAHPVVGITGPVASGKSTLAGRLASDLAALALSTDRYLPDYDGLTPEQRDHPSRSDLDRLRTDLALLRSDGRASVPTWSFHEHRRTGEEHVRATGPIICEGLFALHPVVADALTLRVFVEAPAAERWARWEAIERAGERGWGVDRAREHFHSVAEPTFDRFASTYRASADLIVVNDWTSSS